MTEQSHTYTREALLLGRVYQFLLDRARMRKLMERSMAVTQQEVIACIYTPREAVPMQENASDDSKAI